MKIWLIRLLILLLITPHALAEWISDIDLIYKENNPKLYAKVSEAKKLNSESNGNTQMYLKAKLLVEEVLREDPNFTPAYVQMARITESLGYQRSGSWDKGTFVRAEEYLHKALMLEPNYDYALVILGKHLVEQGELQKAEQYYSKAKKLGTKYPYIDTHQAYILRKKGKYQESLALGIEIYNKNRDDPVIALAAITEIIKNYREFGGPPDSEEVENWQKKRLELAPEVAWFWGDYAQTQLYFSGDPDTAVLAAEKALSLMNYGIARRVLAAALYAKWSKYQSLPMLSPEKVNENNELYTRAQAIYPNPDTIINFFAFYEQHYGMYPGLASQLQSMKNK